jgi:hypothetical protein
MNTPQKGAVRCIIFKDGDTWYGVALEFNIVESADDPDVVQVNLNEAIRGYVESQRKIKGSRVAPLNQKTDPEYEVFWKNLNDKNFGREKLPYPVSYYGVAPLYV